MYSHAPVEGKAAIGKERRTSGQECSILIPWAQWIDDPISALADIWYNTPKGI